MSGKEGGRRPDQRTLIETRAGSVVGFAGPLGGHVWLGIPYAAPPTGRSRWHAPRPARRWQGLLSALAPGAPSAQRAPITLNVPFDPSAVIGSEDCLYLNVWAPQAAETGNRRLPVMVWIHGGGNLLGQGDAYDGEKLATTQGVVVVTLNYRLGVFGWFTHAALRAEAKDAAERSGNFAVLDMIAALQWVRDNIALFGGDPANVTIFGESAGGWNVFALLGSTAAAGLFHRAIVQSGGDVTVPIAEGENFVDDKNPGDLRSSGEILLHLLILEGQAKDRASAKSLLASMQPDRIGAYLRGKPYVEFVRAYDAIMMNGMRRHSLAGFPHLFRDGAVLPGEGISAAIEAGHYNRVPVVLGSTRDEYRLMLPISTGEAFVRPLPGMRFAIDDKPRYLLAAEYLTSLWKADAVDRPAAALQRHQPGRVFAYRFDWAELKPAPWLDGIDIGACHGLDVPFVFGHLHLGPEFMQLALFGPENMKSYAKLSDAMMSYWAAFARDGDPGAGRRGAFPSWRSWEGEGQSTIMVLASFAQQGPHMASIVVSKDGLLTRLAEDPRISSQEERCRFLRDLTNVALGWRFEPEDYAKFEGGACARSLPL